MSLICIERQHLGTPWLRWMIRYDPVQNANIMQDVGTQDTSILDDERFRQFRFVTFQVATHFQPVVIISVHEVKLEFATMGEDACAEHPLFESMIQEMITDNEFKSLSCISHPIPASPSPQARVFREPHIWHSLSVEIVTRNFRVWVNPARVQEL